MNGCLWKYLYTVLTTGSRNSPRIRYTQHQFESWSWPRRKYSVERQPEIFSHFDLGPLTSSNSSMPTLSGLFKSFENIPTALTMKLRMIRASALSLVPHLCFFLLWFDKSTAKNATTHPSEGPYQSLFLQTWLNVNLLGLWWCDN